MRVRGQLQRFVMHPPLYNQGTWVTLYCGDIGDTLDGPSALLMLTATLLMMS